MLMSFRWYGKKLDKIPLEYIRQIPGMKNVVTAIYHLPVGEAWPLADIMALKKEIEAAGLSFKTVESVNVHEDIKLGLATRDKYIKNYNTTLKNLSKAGIEMVCYNFMPVFDWTRTDLAQKLPDNSTALFYDEKILKNLEPEKLIADIEKGSQGFELPGWEKERLSSIKNLLNLYQDIDATKLFDNLKYFLEAIIPTAEACNIKMGLHPDDPPWPLFGLPRIATDLETLDRIVNLVDSPANGLSLCTGSLGADPANNIPAIIRHFGKLGKIHFAHVRNIKIYEKGVFGEVAHKDDTSSLDMYAIMKALYDTNFQGPLRPDHGRMIWGETGMPGYGLYDRALGAVYLNGLWDAIDREATLGEGNFL